MRALLDYELDSVAGGLAKFGMDSGGFRGLQTAANDITGSVRRDSTGNPTGANFSGTYDDWRISGGAGNDSANLSVGTGAFNGTLNYNGGNVVFGVNGTATFNSVNVNAGFNSNGDATGSLSLSAGGNSWSINQAGGSFSHSFGNGFSATGSLSGDTWSLNFNNGSNSSWTCSVGANYNSSSGVFGFSGYCATNFWDLGY